MTIWILGQEHKGRKIQPKKERTKEGYMTTLQSLIVVMSYVS